MLKPLKGSELFRGNLSKGFSRNNRPWTQQEILYKQFQSQGSISTGKSSILFWPENCFSCFFVFEVFFFCWEIQVFLGNFHFTTSSLFRIFSVTLLTKTISSSFLIDNRFFPQKTSHTEPMNWKASENCLFSWSIETSFILSLKPFYFRSHAFQLSDFNAVNYAANNVNVLKDRESEKEIKAEVIRFIYGFEIEKYTHIHTHTRDEDYHHFKPHIAFRQRLKTSHRLRLFPQEWKKMFSIEVERSQKMRSFIRTTTMTRIWKRNSTLLKSFPSRTIIMSCGFDDNILRLMAKDFPSSIQEKYPCPFHTLHISKELRSLVYRWFFLAFFPSLFHCRHDGINLQWKRYRDGASVRSYYIVIAWKASFNFHSSLFAFQFTFISHC